ncbi:MAG TPA: hypothetical protein VFU05_18845 [Cyclobacteriaceae bacterium]|nr:hypothetical protein [Cyclobacteriaceae bacterium]
MTKYFFAKKNKYKYSGNVVTLGKQDIGVTQKEIYDIANLPHSSIDKSITDEEYLRLLGFSKVDSLEYSTMDGATIAHDLNSPLPEELHGKFDWIIDGGTLEHCFNVKEFMTTMVKLLKPGGHILHMNPSQGSSNHGLFNFQPTFYYSFYGSNGFTSMECDLLEIHVQPKEIFTNKDVKGKVIPVKNYNNLAYFSGFPTYNAFHAVKPMGDTNKEVTIPIQEFYYRIFKEKEKVGGGMIADDLYKQIRGDVDENTVEGILKNAYWL